MRRIIVAPVDLGGSALDELKAWLGISRSSEDDLVITLLRASLDACEGYTGQMPLAQLVEEIIPARAGCYGVSSRPFVSGQSVELIAQDGTRSPLSDETVIYQHQSPNAVVAQVPDDQAGQSIAIRFYAGIAQSWEEVPSALKQGIIRFAAHLYRDRDITAGGKIGVTPPPSVTALWRPWRKVRLT